MMQNFRDQAARFGTRFITDDATEISLGRSAATSTASPWGAGRSRPAR